MKCLVTGCAGFIGSHLTERLIADGHTVVGIDSLVVGRLENLGPVAKSDRFTFHQADVADAAAIAAAFDGAEWVFHLAARADIVPSIQEPLVYHRANVDGTVAVLEAARHANAKRFVYIASSSCYGIPDAYPTPETAPPRPMYPYALTKWLGEEYAMHWARTYGLPAVSLRLFNVYGPRHRTSGAYGAVFGVFLRQKIAGEPYTVVGDGTQTRDFTFVTDVVDAIVAAARSDASAVCLNVGSDNTYSINRLVELLGGPTVSVPKRPGEPDCTWADTARIKATLGWAPKVALEDGVREMLDNIDYWRDAPLWTPETISVATRDWFRHLGPGGN